ncbi:MAG: VOC family protein [Spirochaetes bacterium]|nr:VOC family protein [Spirochaetota bacterium]
MLQKVIPFIWFETEAIEAAKWYTSIFPDSEMISIVTLPGTPGQDTNIVNLNLWGRHFQFISAGKLYDRNPSFSYMAACRTVEEVNQIWKCLSDQAEILMPLAEYPFSKRYGWLKDKFGVSWQIMQDGGMNIQHITPSLMFVGDVCGKAEEAMNFYCSLFQQAGILEGHISHYGKNKEPNKPDTLEYARFHLEGQEFVVMDSALDHNFQFNEMQTFIVYGKKQSEVDFFWNKLSAIPEAEQCGWVKDRYGVSWQIIPEIMEKMMVFITDKQKQKLVEAFLPMKKLNVNEMLAAVYPKDNKITVETVIAAPLEKVWDHWISPEHVKNYYFATEDWHCPYAENNLEVGGSFKYRMASKDGKMAFDFEGEYGEIINQQKILYIMPDGRQVEVKFETLNNKTSVKEIFDPEDTINKEQQKSGWQAILDHFKNYLEN